MTRVLFGKLKNNTLLSDVFSKRSVKECNMSDGFERIAICYIISPGKPSKCLRKWL